MLDFRDEIRGKKRYPLEFMEKLIVGIQENGSSWGLAVKDSSSGKWRIKFNGVKKRNFSGREEDVIKFDSSLVKAP